MSSHTFWSFKNRPTFIPALDTIIEEGDLFTIPQASKDFIWVPLIFPFTIFPNRDRMNLINSYINFFRKTKWTQDWFHIQVNGSDIESFQCAMKKNLDKCKTLVMSYWLRKPTYNRHIIVTSSKNYFLENVYPYFRCNFIETINSEQKLMDILMIKGQI